MVDILCEEALPVLSNYIRNLGKFFSTLAALQTDSELGPEQTFAAVAASAVQNEDDLLHLVGIKPLCSVL